MTKEKEIKKITKKLEQIKSGKFTVTQEDIDRFENRLEKLKAALKKEQKK